VAAEEPAPYAPFVNESTFAIIKLDPAKLDLEAVEKAIKNYPGLESIRLEQTLKDLSKTLKFPEKADLPGVLKTVTGGKPLYCVVSGCHFDPTEMAFVICFEHADVSVVELGKVMGLSEEDMLKLGKNKSFPPKILLGILSEAIHPNVISSGTHGKTDYIFAKLPLGSFGSGSKVTVELFSDLWPAKSRPDLEAALQRGADSPVCVAVGLPKYAIETLKMLKPSKKFDVGKITEEGVQWAALTVHQKKPATIDLTVQSESPAAAEACRKMLVYLVDDAYKIWLAPEVKKDPIGLAFWVSFRNLVAPKVAGDQVRSQFPLEYPALKLAFEPALKLLALKEGKTMEDFDQFVAKTLKVYSQKNVFIEHRQKNHRLNSMRIIGLAMFNYHDAHKHFPPPYTVDKNGKPLHSWRVLLLPYLEEGKLYQKIRLDEPWDSEHNKQFHNAFIKVYQNDKNLPPGHTRYSVVVGPQTVFPADGKGLPIHKIRDGTSNTIMMVERTQSVCWMEPTDLSFDQLFQTKDLAKNICFRKGRFGYLMCDGSVQINALKPTSDFLRAFLTANGKEVISYSADGSIEVTPPPEKKKDD
jgi:hypothetical protein